GNSRLRFRDYPRLSQIACDGGSRLPVVVLAVDVSDRSGCKLFRRDVFQASQVDSIDLTDAGEIAYAKRAHPAMFAEIVLVAHGVEQVLGQLRLAREQAKRPRLYDRRPEAVSGADRTVAPKGPGAEVDVGFEAHCSAVTTALVGLQHVIPLEGVLRPFDVLEALEVVRAQGKAESRAIRRVHRAIRPDVERLVEELPHHRHVALAYFQDVTIGCGHGDVDAGRKQDGAAPGMRREPYVARRSQRGDAADFRETSPAGHGRLGNIERVVAKQALKAVAREFALARCDGNGGGTPDLRLAAVVFGRHRLLEPGDIVRLQCLGELDGHRHFQRAVGIDHQLDLRSGAGARGLHAPHALFDGEAVAAPHAHLHRGKPFCRVAAELAFGFVSRGPAAASITANHVAHRSQRLVDRYPQGLALHVPDGDIHAGDRFHHHPAAAAHFGLRYAALQRRLGAGAVVDLFVGGAGNGRVFADRFRGELVLDNGGDDGRRPQSRAHAHQAVVGLYQHQGCIAFHLRSQIGAMLLLRGHRVGHRNGAHTDDFHRCSFLLG